MDVGKPEIEVLMATWNGERFVEEQLDSLFSQTFQDFTLIIRDDGSTDSTLEIVQKYRQRYSGRVFVYRNSSQLGPSSNFSLLAQESVAPYVAFCDQDDIWHKNKLSTGLTAMNSIEKEYGSNTPVLVFSDMTPINENKEILAPSWWRKAHVNPDRASLGAMLVQNLVTGCTMMANRSLIVKSGSIPPNVEMHDSWLGLVAAAFGVLCPLAEPTVQYRQHDRNAWASGRRKRNGNPLKNMRHHQELIRERVEISRRQAKLFALRYEKQLTAQQRLMLAVWINSGELPPFVRQWVLHRNGLRGTTWHNHLGFLARI